MRVVTMEKHPPYSPMSLPYLISERVSPADIQMVPDDFFSQMNATLLKNRRVVRVDPRSQSRHVMITVRVTLTIVF